MSSDAGTLEELRERWLAGWQPALAALLLGALTLRRQTP